MPLDALAKLADGNGFWAFLGSVITVICLTFVRLLMLLLMGRTNRDTNLAERESKLVEHLSGEIDRLNTVVLSLDTMMKMQAQEHRQALITEREECNARMTGMQAEIEILKRRMSKEEHR